MLILIPVGLLADCYFTNKDVFILIISVNLVGFILASQSMLILLTGFYIQFLRYSVVYAAPFPSVTRCLQTLLCVCSDGFYLYIHQISNQSGAWSVLYFFAVQSLTTWWRYARLLSFNISKSLHCVEIMYTKM